MSALSQPASSRASARTVGGRSLGRRIWRGRFPERCHCSRAIQSRPMAIGQKGAARKVLATGNRRQGVRQRVPPQRRPLRDPLAPRRRGKVFVERLDQRRARHARQHGALYDAQRDRRQKRALRAPSSGFDQPESCPKGRPVARTAKTKDEHKCRARSSGSLSPN